MANAFDWTRRGLLFAVLCVAPASQAEVVVPPPATITLPPPPAGNYSGAARTVFSFFNMYYNYAQDSEFCILSMRSAADSFKRNAETIATLPEPTRTQFAEYFQKQLVPFFARTSGGVEGMGTYNELVAKRQASQQWLTDNKPKGPAATAEEIAAYGAKEQAYLARAAEDSAWVERAFAINACMRWAERRSNEIPALGDFGIYRRSWVAEAPVRKMLRETRQRLVPELSAHAVANNTLKHQGQGPWRTAREMGDALLMMAAAVKNIDGENAKAQLVEHWIKALDATEGALLQQILAGRSEARAAALAFFKAKLDTMGLPEGVSDGAAAGQAKALGATQGALAVRVTSPMATFNEDRTEFAGKIFLRPVKFAGKTFAFALVRKGAPWKDWPTELGGSDLCSMVVLTGTYYSAGANVALNKWELHSDITYPIACSNKNKTYTP